MSVNNFSYTYFRDITCLFLCFMQGVNAPAIAQDNGSLAFPEPTFTPTQKNAEIFLETVPLEQPPMLWEIFHPTGDPHGIAAAVPKTHQALPLPLQLESGEPSCDRDASSNLDAKAETSQILTLPQAIDQALCHSAEVRAAWSNIRQQTAQLGTAQAAYWPTANAAWSRIDDRVDYKGGAYPAARNRSNRSSLNINWRIFDFGTRSGNLDLMRHQLRAAIASRNETLLKVVLKVLQAYTNAQATQSALQIRKSMRMLSEQTLDSAKRREHQGVGSRSETLQAHASLSRSDLQVSQAEGAWQEARAVLIYLLGLPTGRALELPAEPIEQEMKEVAAAPRHGTQQMQVFRELDQWLLAVREHHPAIMAAQAQWQAAAAKLHTTQAEGMPNVDISFGYYSNGRPTQDITSYRSSEHVVALTLNIPLFDGFAHTYRVQDARAQTELKRIQYEDTVANTLQEFTKLYVRAQAAWRNLQAAENLMHANNSAQASERRRFEHGVTDLLHLLQSQNNLSESKIEYLNARLAWNALRLELMMVSAAVK